MLFSLDTKNGAFPLDLKLIYEPSVFLVGRQVVVQEEVDRFLESIDAAEWSSDAPSAAEQLVELASRGCYQSYKKPRPGGNKAHLEHIIDVGHGSVVEHAVWSFMITGVSRTLTHELIRQRVGISPSELSQRFVDCSNVAFVVPPLMLSEMDETDDEEDDPLFRAWKESLSCSLEAYDLISSRLTERVVVGSVIPSHAWHDGQGPESYAELNDKIAELPQSTKTWLRKSVREAARSVLPGCTETKIFITANARALRHMLEMRGSLEADAEFQRLVGKILPIMQKEAPNLFGDYTNLSGEGVKTKHRKI